MKISKFAPWLLWLGTLLGFAGQVFALYAIQNPGLRVRLGLISLVVIAVTLAAAPRDARAAAHPVRRRRFILLRRRVGGFLNEVSRLNWLIADVNRDPRAAARRADEVEASKQRIHRLVEGVIEAAGVMDAKPESELPFEPRFHQAAKEQAANSGELVEAQDAA